MKAEYIHENCKTCCNESCCHSCDGVKHYVKQQSTSEEIREAFRINAFENFDGGRAVDLEDAISICDKKVKAAQEKSKAEIEELKGKYKKKLYLSINQDSRIKELEQQNIDLRCCGNCRDDGNQEMSNRCEYCIRFEDNGDEGREFQDYWKPTSK